MIRQLVGAGAICIAFLGSPSSAEQYRIAHNRNLSPLTEVQDGKSVGVAIDLLRAVAARADIEIVFVPVALDQQIPSIHDGRADAIVFTHTPDREQSLDFSSPVLMTGGALFVRVPNSTPATLASLSGKTVVTPGAGPLADVIRRTASTVNLAVTQNNEESLSRVVTGQADAAALNFVAGTRTATRLFPGQITLPQAMFYEVPFSVAVPKGQRAKLLKQIDAGIAAIRADGTWQQINARWMGN